MQFTVRHRVLHFPLTVRHHWFQEETPVSDNGLLDSPKVKDNDEHSQGGFSKPLSPDGSGDQKSQARGSNDGQGSMDAGEYKMSLADFVQYPKEKLLLTI